MKGCTDRTYAEQAEDPRMDDWAGLTVPLEYLQDNPQQAFPDVWLIVILAVEGLY